MKNIKSILYLGGIDHTGENAQFRLFKKLFYDSIDRERTKCEFNIDGVLLPGHNGNRDFSEYDLVVLGGGKLLNSDYWLDIVDEVQKINIPTVSWGTTVEGLFTCKEDLIDYSKFYPDNTLEKLHRVIAGMKYISVLGEYTKDVLVNSGLDASIAIDVIGEPLLLQEDTQSATDRASNKVLVNWGAPVNIPGVDWDSVGEQFETTIQILINRGYYVTVYPVNTIDIEYVEKLGRRFNESNLNIVSVVNDVNGILELIRGSMFSINYNYFSNVLSAAMNRPFIALSDDLDCLDFAVAINCSHMIMPIANFNAGKILARIASIENNYDEVVEKLKNAKEKYSPIIYRGIKILHDIIE